METNLNNSEERLYDLLESRDWKELSEEEQQWVLVHLTPEAYSLQREIILAMEEDRYEQPAEPLPLMIPEKRKPLVLRSIPLYQALAAVAAVIVLFLVIRPAHEGSGSGQPETSSPVQAAAETKYIHDTVVQYVTVTKKETQTIVDTIREFISFPKDAGQPKLLEASAGPAVPELSNEKLMTRGASLKDENTSHFLPVITNTIY